MLSDSLSSNAASQRPTNTHNASACGFVKKHWYIAEVKPTRERTCRDLLLRDDITAYVASQPVVRVYKNYSRRTTERIIIPGKVFVSIPEADLINVLKDYSSFIYKFMLNRAASPDGSRGLPLAVIPDLEMQQMQFMLGHAPRPVLFSSVPLKAGDRVQIIRGPLTGLVGTFLREANASFIVISLDLLGQTLTEISQDDIQPLSSLHTF